MCCTSFPSALPFIPLFLFLSQCRNIIYFFNMTLALSLSLLSICQYVSLLAICQGSTLIHQKVAPPTEGHGSPVLSFITLEQFNAIRLVQVCQITSVLTNNIFYMFSEMIATPALHCQKGKLFYENCEKWALLHEMSVPHKWRHCVLAAVCISLF